MRDIKFRAWDTLKQRMVEVYGIDFSNGLPSVIHTKAESETTKSNTMVGGRFVLMQYTGLKDKNGKDIYEGDILKNTKHKNQLVEVYWRGCLVGASSVNGKNWIDWGGWKFRKLNEDNDFTYTIHQDSIEIIGNIYENPELLDQ